jgi:hypothetical protein
MWGRTSSLRSRLKQNKGFSFYSQKIRAVSEKPIGEAVFFSYNQAQ